MFVIVRFDLIEVQGVRIASLGNSKLILINLR